MSKRVLVIGGTGMLGLPVAKQLKADGFQITILSTNKQRAIEKVGDAFDIFEGDVTKPETLKAPMEGCFGVYLNLNAELDAGKYQTIEIEGTANAARIAAESGVQRISHISGSSSKGQEKGIIYLDAKVKAENAIIESGVPYTIMRPTWFFESLPLSVRGGRAGVLGKQPIGRYWLSAADYARQVSQAFQKEEAANKCFYNYGPEQWTMMEALAKFCERHHPDIKPQQVSFMMAKLLSKAPGMEVLELLVPFFEYFEDNPEDADPSEANKILGPNTTTIDQWLETYRQPQ